LPPAIDHFQSFPFVALSFLCILIYWRVQDNLFLNVVLRFLSYLKVSDLVATRWRQMAIASLTKRAIDALPPREKAYIVFDGRLPGFGLRVAPTGRKTFVLEYRPHGGGRGVAKKRLTIGAHGPLTADAARKAALDALARVRRGEDPQADKEGQRAAVTVSTLIEEFIDGHVNVHCKPKTRVPYVAVLTRLRIEHGSLKAEALKWAQVAAMHTSMAETPFVANRFLAVTSKMFSWAEERGFIPEGHVNPTGKIQRYREEPRERFLTAAELAKLGAALEKAETVGLPYAVDETKPTAKHAPKSESRLRTLDPYAVAAIRLLILTGARLHEILDARWEFINSEKGLLDLPDSKTGKKSIHLNAAAIEILTNLPRVNGNPHIIAGANDGAPRADLNKPWNALKKAAGLEGLRLHDLRHSFASVGAGGGLSLPIIGAILGHSQASTTQRYAHLGDDPRRAAVEQIGSAIDATMRRKPSAEVIPLRRGS
jgi:integrase